MNDRLLVRFSSLSRVLLPIDLDSKSFLRFWFEINYILHMITVSWFPPSATYSCFKFELFAFSFVLYESVLSLLPCAIQLVQKKDTISALFFFYFFFVLFCLPSSSSARSTRKKCAYQMTKKCIKFSTASFVIDTRTGKERKGSIADFCPKK